MASDTASLWAEVHKITEHGRVDAACLCPLCARVKVLYQWVETLKQQLAARVDRHDRDGKALLEVSKKLVKVTEERDIAVAALRQTLSPAESCIEEREAGNGGCGVCAICCKEWRDKYEKLQEENATYHCGCGNCGCSRCNL